MRYWNDKVDSENGGELEDMNAETQRGNVLVIGNSGVGKSTLINAVLGEDRAEAGFGSEGTTKELRLYENESLPFRLIDSVGFEPSFWKRKAAIRAVRRWSRNSIRTTESNSQINVIWFCVDGTSSKLFSEVINNLIDATKIWKSVPIIAVITKSYSKLDRPKNIEMVKEAFARQKRGDSLREIIPVVASPYVLNDDAFAPPEGIMELIEATNRLLPEGTKAARNDMSDYLSKRNQVLAQGVVGLAALSGAAVGATKLDGSDALVLEAVENFEINGIAGVYGLGSGEEVDALIEAVVGMGTVSKVAKSAVGLIGKSSRASNGTRIINTVVAATIVVVLGEGAIYLFDQIKRGNRSVDDLEWVTTTLESCFSEQIVEGIARVEKMIRPGMQIQNIVSIVLDVFQQNQKSSRK